MTTMEDLTKTQIVLLTLLVSFITSIATGIITSSLLAQAPQNVTQTIDRVVERTVEQVAPTTSGAATVKEVTVVSEGDAVVGAVDASSRAIVHIKAPAGADGVQNFYAMGVVVGKQGLVLSDKRDLGISGMYSVVFSDGTTYPATFLASSDTGSLTLFKLVMDDAHLKALAPAVLSKTDPKLGQTVIAIEGASKPAIAVGRALSLDASAGSVTTDINPANETQGGALLNLSGELLGLKTSNADLTLTAGGYTVVSSVARFIAAHQ